MFIRTVAVHENETIELAKGERVVGARPSASGYKLLRVYIAAPGEGSYAKPAPVVPTVNSYDDEDEADYPDED